MSHTTTIRGMRITSGAAIRAAVAELQRQGAQVSLVENAKPRMYYQNQHGDCAFVIKLPGRYDLGLDKQTDGSYAPVFDAWNGEISNTLGASCPLPSSAEGRAQHTIGKFLQGYAKHAAMMSAVDAGYLVDDVTTDAAGNVHLTISGMAA